MKYILILVNKILIRSKIMLFFHGKDSKIRQPLETEKLINNHFLSINEINHPCRESLTLGLSFLENADKIVIIETGSSAWGTNSSMLFDKYLSNRIISGNCEGSFYTCDIRINPALELQNQVSRNTTLVRADSVKFLEFISTKIVDTDHRVLIYLDSFDLDYKNPNPSGLHGFKEFLSIIPLLKKGTILLIDDSPIDLDSCPKYAKDAARKYFDMYGIYPGKAMFVDPVISKFNSVKKIFHKYQIVYIVE